MVWSVLVVLSALALLAHWRGPNAVWGAATLGVVVGAVTATVQPGFDLVDYRKVVRHCNGTRSRSGMGTALGDQGSRSAVAMQLRGAFRG